jgi:hypothetical protein
MASGPWRCSQCGTVNEPVANSCRTCGKWPSLFDLEDSVLEDADVEAHPDAEPVPTYDVPVSEQTSEAPEPVTVEVDTFEPAEPSSPRRRFEPPPTEPVLDEGETGRRPKWVSWLVPLGIVAYFVISAILNR